MYVKGIQFRNSIFIRLFYTFLAIMIPIMLAGYGIYNFGIQSVKEQITSAMYSKVEFFIQSLEEEVRKVRLLQSSILMDNNIWAISITDYTDTDYNRDKEVNRTKERLSSIIIGSRFIEEASIYLPRVSKTISTTAHYNMLEEEMDLVNEHISKPTGQIEYWKGSYLLNRAFPMVKGNNSQLPMTLCSLRLSTRELEEAIKSFTINNGSAFLYSTDLYTMIPGESNAINQEIKRAIIHNNNENSSLINGQKPYTVKIDGSGYLVTYEVSDFLNLMFVAYTPDNTFFDKIGQYNIFIWILLVAVLVIMAIFSLYAYRVVHRPLSDLVDAFSKVEKGDMDAHIKHSSKGEFRYIFDGFNTMLNNLTSLIDQVYKHKILVQKAELKQLQSQINPHFLYNSFFILHRRIKYGDIDNAVRFSQQLGNYFQFITRSAADEVQLSREVEHARIYAKIQAMRFSNRISLLFEELPSELSNVIVPRLILQPVIENAFEHGLEDLEEKGRLYVGYEEKDGQLNIIVEDNGRNLTDQELEKMRHALEIDDGDMETTGMINIHRRVKLKFGSSSGLVLSRGEEGGLKVVIKIEKGWKEK